MRLNDLIKQTKQNKQRRYTNKAENVTIACLVAKTKIKFPTPIKNTAKRLFINSVTPTEENTTSYKPVAQKTAITATRFPPINHNSVGSSTVFILTLRKAKKADKQTAKISAEIIASFLQ